MELEVCIGMCGRAGGGDSLTETRGSRSHWKDTVEMWAVWEEAMTPLRHIVEGRSAP